MAPWLDNRACSPSYSHPVLAVPPTVSDPVPLNDAASGNLGPVLAATDFSDTSARALRWAADLAHEIASPLLLVHVVEPIAVAPQWQPYIEDADEARVADARVQLDKADEAVRRFCGM